MTMRITETFVNSYQNSNYISFSKNGNTRTICLIQMLPIQFQYFRGFIFIPLHNPLEKLRFRVHQPLGKAKILIFLYQPFLRYILINQTPRKNPLL
ncbi:hypothetical protein Hanom_Chr06g00499201 [Helianthus anomalus]